MSRVSYDNPHHHSNPSHQPTTIKAGGDSGGVFVRGGGGGAGVEVEVAGGAVAAKGTGRDGVRHGGGEIIAPATQGAGLPVGVSAVGGGTARRAVMVDRRATGRYAYTSTSSSTGAARDGDGSIISRALEDDSNVSGGGGGGGGGVRVVGLMRTPSTCSSPLLSKPKEL